MSFIYAVCLVFALIAPPTSPAQGVAEYQKHLEPKVSAPPEQPGQTGTKEKPAPPPTQGFAVPKPTIITQPNFKPKTSYGVTTDIDGTPLTDHKIYSIDTSFFITKIRDGVSKQGDDAHLQELLQELEKAALAYDQAEGTIHQEEQTTLGNPVRLEDNPNPRGKELRDQMKDAITKMAEIRDNISSQYASFLSAGHLPEEQ